MRPDESADRLRDFARANGVDLKKCTPQAGIAQMLAFYREVAVEGCSDEDGDMLLFQWGTYDWGKGKAFELDITRQFIDMHPDYGDDDEDDDGDDDEQGQFSQLSLTFHFAPSPELDALDMGNRWCESQADLADFEAYVAGTAPMLSLGDKRAKRVVVDHELV